MDTYKNIVIFLRSTLFNLLFYGLTAAACVLCLPGLFLPREKAMLIVRAFVGATHWLEKHVIGLDYEVRGAENLPRKGAFIVAAKHQSPYETFKLHLLFADPAVVLKQELLRIPLWGRFLAKTEPVAIDRSNGREAMAQMIEGAKKVQAQDRPLVIFPQGTRVYPWQTPAEKPYKLGVARLSAETGMPVVPLALNAGTFWPRQSWIKKPGTVVFQFLPPVPPDTDARAMTAALQERLETASDALRQEALK